VPLKKLLTHSRRCCWWWWWCCWWWCVCLSICHEGNSRKLWLISS